jgi:UTP-glucose-1-phosphate uridylyltransferase
VIIYRFADERFDCGSVLGFVPVTAVFAMARDHLAHGVSTIMKSRGSYGRIAASRQTYPFG